MLVGQKRFDLGDRLGKTAAEDGASAGNALKRRDGVAASRITKQPLSFWLRINRPKACFNLSRVRRSS